MPMDFDSAQTQVSKEEHSLHNLLHMCIANICAWIRTGVHMQLHTVHSLLSTDTNVSGDQNRVS